MTKQDKQRLGDLLISANLIDEVQLKVALNAQQETGERLGSALVHLGFIDESVLAAFLSKQTGLPCVNVNGLLVPQKVLDLIPRDLAVAESILPVRRTGDTLYLAMTDPFDEQAQGKASAVSGLEVIPMIAPEFALKNALERFYSPEKLAAERETQELKELASEIDKDEINGLSTRIQTLTDRVEELTGMIRELRGAIDREE